MNLKNKKLSKGFSLLELSLVMVIAAIIIASTLTGVGIIKTSEVKSTIDEIDRYRSAINSFSLKYNGLPGDLNNANDFWSVTADGNGNGKLDNDAEYYDLWQQLYLARFIANSYTGNGTDAALGSNVPISKIIRAGYIYMYKSNPGSYTDNLGRGFSDNYLIIGNESTPTIGSDYLDGDALTPEFSFFIDRKIDNGLPENGDILAVDGEGSSTCISSNEYNLSSSVTSCIVLIR